MLNKIISVVSIFFLILLFTGKAQAASGTISLSPQSGNYAAGSEFNVTLAINGGGVSFNAAAATVTVAPTLSIQSVTLGDCDFAFVTTPTAANPSFAGVILGSSSNSCTLYTLKVRAISQGAGTLALSNGSIKAYSGAGELLADIGSASYTITGNSGSTIISIVPTQPPILGVGGQSFYNINYSIGAQVSSPSQLTVVLDPDLSSKTAVTPAAADKAYVAKFENVPAGVHTITTYEKNKQIASQVVNVTGGNREIQIGNQTKAASQISPAMLAGIAIMLLIAVGILAYFGYKYYVKKKEEQKPGTSKPINYPVKK